MKRIVTVVVMLLVGVAAGYAQDNPVKMKDSGPELTTAMAINGSTYGGEEVLTGDGSLGKFTYFGLRADSNNVTVTDPCPNGYIPVSGGAGIFRFSDGSLMSASITGGNICIDASQVGHLTETFQVTGGTGRFQNATGELTRTATLNVLLSDDTGLPLLLTNAGELDGSIMGVNAGQGAQGK